MNTTVVTRSNSIVCTVAVPVIQRNVDRLTRCTSGNTSTVVRECGEGIDHRGCTHRDLVTNTFHIVLIVLRTSSTRTRVELSLVTTILNVVTETVTSGTNEHNTSITCRLLVVVHCSVCLIGTTVKSRLVLRNETIVLGRNVNTNRCVDHSRSVVTLPVWMVRIVMVDNSKDSIHITGQQSTTITTLSLQSIDPSFSRDTVLQTSSTDGTVCTVTIVIFVRICLTINSISRIKSRYLINTIVCLLSSTVQVSNVIRVIQFRVEVSTSCVDRT